MKKVIFSLLLLCASYCCYAVGGPYPMDYILPIDDDEAKVIVFSTPSYTGGSLWIKNTETNEEFFILSSVTYMPRWYYVIPQGTYVITSIQNGYSVQSQGSTRVVGDEVSFNGGGGYFMLCPN